MVKVTWCHLKQFLKFYKTQLGNTNASKGNTNAQGDNEIYNDNFYHKVTIKVTRCPLKRLNELSIDAN